MLISATFLVNAMKKCPGKSQRHILPGVPTPTPGYLEYTHLVIGVFLFMLELSLMVYALRQATRRSRYGLDRMVNIALAMFFTLPYVLFDVFLGYKRPLM